MAKPALKTRLVKEMTTRSLANVAACVNLVETYSARTDPCPVHAKLTDIDNCAAIHGPFLKFGAPRGREEIDDPVQFPPKLNHAIIEEVDFNRIGYQRNESVQEKRVTKCSGLT